MGRHRAGPHPHARQREARAAKLGEPSFLTFFLSLSQGGAGGPVVSLPGPLQVPVFLVPKGRPVPRCRFWGLSHTREPPAIPCASVGSGSRRPPRRSRAHGSVTASDPVRELGPWRGRRARKRGRGGPSAQTGLSFCDDVRPSPMRPPTQHGDRSLDPDHYLVWGLAGVGLGRGLGGAGSSL